MSLRKRWTAQCDAPGCDSTWIAPAELRNPFEDSPERWDAGIAISDLGWDAAPGRDETFCPAHELDMKEPGDAR